MEAGYLLSVTTWENDADYYQTHQVDGLTKEDVEFYISILSKFGSRHGSRNFQPGYGNTKIDAEELLMIITDALDNHPGISKKVKDKYYTELRVKLDSDGNTIDIEEIEEWAEEAHDNLTEVLGETVDYIDWHLFIRVVEEIKVGFIENKSKDVTDKFL